ncbi:MAG: hypothetical protein Q7T03_10150 [Deltaproteobacteria bacterium]|nr:hypothetical protein [Deltaproteobacteria bacterium]
MSQTISASQLYNTAGKIYGQRAQAPLAKILTEYGFGETVDVFQENPGDGAVSIPYEIFQDKTPIRGVLRFASDGSIYDGLQKLNTRLGTGVGSLLVASAFGEAELGRKPAGLDTQLLKSALNLYACLGSNADSQSTCLGKTDGKLASLKRTRTEKPKKLEVQNGQKANENNNIRDAFNQKTETLLNFANQVKDISIRDHTPWIIPWGKNKDKVTEILAEELPMISATRSDTLEGSRDRITRTMQMINRLMEISEGKESCEDISGCSVEKGSEPSCSADYDGYPPVTYSYQGMTLRSTSGGCSKKQEPIKHDNPCAGGMCRNESPSANNKPDPRDRQHFGKWW